MLSEDAEGFLRVMLVHLRSLAAKSRNDLARVLERTNVDHLLVLTSDFDTLEFVLLDKRRRELRGSVAVQRIQVVPLSLAVARKAVGTRQLRTLRRFTWTGRDGLEQFDKLRSVFEAAAFSEDYFCNRALFERDRGEIARSERSALAPAAQPLQDLLDRIIYRMADLTDDEAAGLEARLARML